MPSWPVGTVCAPAADCPKLAAVLGPSSTLVESHGGPCCTHLTSPHLITHARQVSHRSYVIANMGRLLTAPMSPLTSLPLVGRSPNWGF